MPPQNTQILSILRFACVVLFTSTSVNMLMFKVFLWVASSSSSTYHIFFVLAHINDEMYAAAPAMAFDVRGCRNASLEISCARGCIDILLFYMCAMMTDDINIVVRYTLGAVWRWVCATHLFCTYWNRRILWHVRDTSTPIYLCT